MFFKWKSKKTPAVEALFPKPSLGDSDHTQSLTWKKVKYTSYLSARPGTPRKPGLGQGGDKLRSAP